MSLSQGHFSAAINKQEALSGASVHFNLRMSASLGVEMRQGTGEMGTRQPQVGLRSEPMACVSRE
jgi:hypothetical protein